MKWNKTKKIKPPIECITTEKERERERKREKERIEQRPPNHHLASLPVREAVYCFACLLCFACCQCLRPPQMADLPHTIPYHPTTQPPPVFRSVRQNSHHNHQQCATV
ncbi:uncharacterized protein K452DRAFT_124980 [Aplosporella prunicola CBS 121167]|uniref:Uncharacterized protein n=1 Tax=Aplosporella prunicola CBS 121167 TaxID=1176127 RepID=A0A6A6BSF9_9PEZI|nr:uncharacterized protein K452DRAFT_124980 [Aplosporella prunicola CBS 121167]KAF2145757.1 hypothetical protein K452DRAFT_124980 [Aplosporella prunicola CBS 121167]